MLAAPESRRAAAQSRRTGGRKLTNAARQQRVGRVLIVHIMIGVAGASGGVLIARASGGDGGLLPVGVLWACMLAASVFSLTSTREFSVFAFRAKDLVYGLGLAILLRLMGGVISGADTLPFPVTGSKDFGAWAGYVAIPAGMIGPIVEELFFRAVIALLLFRILTKISGRFVASSLAACASAGAFVLLHSLFAPLSLGDALILLILALRALLGSPDGSHLGCGYSAYILQFTFPGTCRSGDVSSLNCVLQSVAGAVSRLA